MAEQLKRKRLTVNLTTGETLVIEGKEVIYNLQYISESIVNEEDIIMFGYMGVRRDLINWYIIERLDEE